MHVRLKVGSEILHQDISKLYARKQSTFPTRRWDNMYEMLSENNFDYDCSWQEHMDTLMQRMDSIPTR